MARRVSPTESSFRRSFHPHLAPQACGVEQPERPALPLEVDGNGVARDSGFRSGDQALLAENRIHQRGFADIGTPDHGDAKRMGGTLVLFARRLLDLSAAILTAGGLLDGVAQLANAEGMLG